MTLKLEDTGDCKQSCDSRLKLEVGKTYVDGHEGFHHECVFVDPKGKYALCKQVGGYYPHIYHLNGEAIYEELTNNLIAEHKAETRCPTCNALAKERAPVVHEDIVWRDMDTVPENQDTVLIKSKDGVHLASLRTIYKESETKSYYLYDEVRGQKRKIVALKWYPLPKEKITYEEK